MSWQQTRRKGIILAGGGGTRLFPLTHAVSKQLLPVYDKPMIYYPLTTLMLAGIQEFLVISTPKDLPQYQYSLGNGEQWGISIVYAEQDRPDGIAQALIVGEDFIAQGPTALILGDNVFYGEGLPRILRSISERDGGATIFGYKVHDPERYGVVLLNDHGTPLEIVEKPLSPKSKFAIPGLYFYDGQASQIARSLQPSSRGELEISDLNRAYLAEGNPQVELLGRGYA